MEGSYYSGGLLSVGDAHTQSSQWFRGVAIALSSVAGGTVAAVLRRGDGEERRTQDPKDEGSNPVRSTREICESFSESKMLCWIAIGVSPPSPPLVYTRTA